MTTKTVIHWDADDPASPALLDPLFDDMGIGKDDTLSPEGPEQKELAREAAKNYFTKLIKERAEEGACPTMGEVNVAGYMFYEAYLAGVKSTTSPIPIKKAIADVAEGCEIFFHLREVEPEEKRVSFLHWIFGKLRGKYGENWMKIWESYLNSPEAGQLIAMSEINEIVANSEFGEED
jgi:hypothetical protein